MQAAVRPDSTTGLAIGRTALAAARTLMRWIRTALSMISFGFAIGKLGEVLQRTELKGLLQMHTYSVRGLADFLVIFGTGALMAACWQHWRRVHALYAQGLPHQVSITLVVAVALSMLGLFALTALVASL